MRDLLGERGKEGFLIQPGLTEIKKEREDFGVKLRKGKRMQLAELKRRIFKEELIPGMDYCLYVGNLPESAVEKFPFLQNLNSEYSKLAALNEIVQDPKLNPEILLDIIRLFRCALLVDDEVNPRVLFLNVGLINTLSCIIINVKIPEIQSEAIWCLCNIAAGPSQYSSSILDTNIVSTLLVLMPNSCDSIIENSTWLIANLLSDSIGLDKELLRQDYLKILENLPITSNKVAIGISISLVNLTKNNSILEKSDYLCILSIFSRIQQFDDTNILWGISNLCKGRTEMVDLVIESNLIQIAFNGLLKESKYSVPSSEIICNISAGNKAQTDFLLQNNLLNLIEKVVFKADDETTKCLFCTLRNIAAGSSRQRKLIQGHSIFIPSMKGLEHPSLTVRHQAIHFFLNICALASSEEKKNFVEAGIFLHIPFTLNDLDAGIILKSLEICCNILSGKYDFPIIETNFKETDCYSILQDLVMHLNPSISSASEFILSALY